MSSGPAKDAKMKIIQNKIDELAKTIHLERDTKFRRSHDMIVVEDCGDVDMNWCDIKNPRCLKFDSKNDHMSNVYIQSNPPGVCLSKDQEIEKEANDSQDFKRWLQNYLSLKKSYKETSTSMCNSKTTEKDCSMLKEEFDSSYDKCLWSPNLAGRLHMLDTKDAMKAINSTNSTNKCIARKDMDKFYPKTKYTDDDLIANSREQIFLTHNKSEESKYQLIKDPNLPKITYAGYRVYDKRHSQTVHPKASLTEIYHYWMQTKFLPKVYDLFKHSTTLNGPGTLIKYAQVTFETMKKSKGSNHYVQIKPTYDSIMRQFMSTHKFTIIPNIGRAFQKIVFELLKSNIGNIPEKLDDILQDIGKELKMDQATVVYTKSPNNHTKCDEALNRTNFSIINQDKDFTLLSNHAFGLNDTDKRSYSFRHETLSDPYERAVEQYKKYEKEKKRN